jgi:uncharacterized protein involved in type VI secretion and phage assembly
LAKGKFVGKYRATVTSNVDPMNSGRLAVQVPDVGALQTSTWAMPAAALAGGGSGLFAVPPVGSNVWVEFEQGDSDYPVWSGCFYGSSAEVPPAALAAPPGVQAIVLQSVGGNMLMLSDVPGAAGGILLKSSSGASIAINDTGITITNGVATIVIAGPSVTINQGALVIT